MNICRSPFFTNDDDALFSSAMRIQFTDDTEIQELGRERETLDREQVNRAGFKHKVSQQIDSWKLKKIE